MENTVIGVFDTYAHAENAFNELLAAGFSRSDLQLDPEAPAGQHAGNGGWSESGGVGNFLRQLFGMKPHHEKHDMYAEAMRRGSCILVVTAGNEQQRQHAEDIMQSCNAVNIEERAELWRSEGWSGYDPTSATMTQGDLAQERSYYAQDLTRGIDSESHQTPAGMHRHVQDHDHRVDQRSAAQSGAAGTPAGRRQIADAYLLSEGTSVIPTDENLHPADSAEPAASAGMETRHAATDNRGPMGTTAGEPRAALGASPHTERTDMMDTMDTMNTTGAGAGAAVTPGGHTDMMDTRASMRMSELQQQGRPTAAAGSEPARAGHAGMPGGSSGDHRSSAMDDESGMASGDLTGGSMGAAGDSGAGISSGATGAARMPGMPSGDLTGGNMGASMASSETSEESRPESSASTGGGMTGGHTTGAAGMAGPNTTTPMHSGTSGMPEMANERASMEADSATPGMTSDDSDFREHWRSAYGQSGSSYEDYDSAYRYGSTLSGTQRFQNYRWSEVEPDLRSEWEANHPESAWDKVKDAVRYGVERASGHRH